MGAVLREQNALPYASWIMKNLTAKDDVDNVGAGRAAKGANPVVSTKKCRKLLEFPAFFIYSHVYILSAFSATYIQYSLQILGLK